VKAFKTGSQPVPVYVNLSRPNSWPTDAGVKAVINIIALIGAFSKTREGPGCHREATGRNFTNRLPFTNSKITKDKPTTYWTKRRVLSTTKRMHDANMQQLIRIIIAS
jgi:hypothetical protein